MSSLQQFIQHMPKINLHVHIEGSIQSSTLLDIAEGNGYINELNEEQINSIKQDSFTYVDFPTFIDTYSMCANALRSASDYEQVTYEYLRTASEENIRYVEAYISPLDRMRRGVTLEEIVEGTANAIKRAEADFGIHMHIVMDVGRHLLWTAEKSPESARDNAIELVEQIIAFKNQGVIGFSIGGKEDGYPVYPFADAFKLARESGLHVKAHAGETSVTDIWYVVGLLGVERIGNSFNIIQDPMLIQYCIDNGISLEICPTGNTLTGDVKQISEHPLKDLLNTDIAIGMGDDDPALFSTSLTSEYRKIAEAFDLSADDIQALVMQSLDITWLDDVTKSTMRQSFESEFAQLRQDLSL